MPKKVVQSNPWRKIAPFALTSLASFLLGALLLFFMVWKADKLVALGLTGRLYYIVLLAFGLSVAVCLFGVLKSHATYQGRQLGGKLALGGPIVAFMLVVIPGSRLAPDPSTFPVTVYVHGSSGPHDIVLRNSGEVFMDLGGDRRHVQIGDQGQAYFPAIPASFRGQDVGVWVDSEKFESTDPGKKLKLDGPNVYIPVRRKAGRISGRVRDENGNGIPGAQVHVAGLSAGVDAASGRFELSIPGDRLQDGLELVAEAPGCASSSYQIVPNSNEISITLSKSR